MDDVNVEVVEEEAVVDDLHLHYDNVFYGEEVYEEYVAEEGAVEVEVADPITHAETVLIKIKPDLIDEGKKRFRVPASEVSDELFDAFCEKVTNFDHEVPAKLEPFLDSLYHSGDWALGRNVPDSYLGLLNPVMVHLPTSKLLLKTGDRSRLFSECIIKNQNTRNPIASSLQEIQKLYTGLPPVGQLRNILMEEVRKVFPLAQTGGEMIAQPTVIATNRKVVKRGKGWKKGAVKVGKKKVVVKAVDEEGNEEAEGGEGQTVNLPKLVPVAPIDDDVYDDLAEVIANGNKELYLSLPVQLQALLAKGSLISGKVPSQKSKAPNPDLEEFIRPGWCIRERTTGKVVPRKGDVQRIWRLINDKMIRTNSLTQIVAYVDARFVGVTTAEQRRAARVEDVYKGSRVVFPQRPTVIGRRPMQYVQIDIIDPPFDEYQSEEAECALLIVDLHSQFAFCKPFLDISAASHEILRFTYDSFSAFGPPESFITATEKNAFYIRTMMEDIERHFKVRIKCTGFTKEHPSAKMIANEAVRKVSADASGFRWMDTIHMAVMEWNQRPNTVFKDACSPFEVMFGRRVWSGEGRLPPWMEEREGEGGGGGQTEGGETNNGNERIPFRERIHNIVQNVMPPEARRDPATGKIIDPGTGFRYEIGDRVYVRNIYYGEPEQPGITSKRRTKGQVNRYLRGVIVEEDNEHPEFVYRVVYDCSFMEQDVMTYDMWPTLQDEESEAYNAEWCSPWDLAPSTYDIKSRRTVNRRSPDDLRCECELSYCDMMATVGCERTMSAHCCARHPNGSCSSHRSGRKVGRKRKGGGEEIERNESRAERADIPEDPAARYMFKDGTLVRVTTIVHRQMELPEEILSDREG